MWFFLFIFFNNFLRKTRAKFGNKENATAVEITSSWSSDIRQSYKLVKDRRRKMSNSTEDLGFCNLTLPMSPTQSSDRGPKGEVSESSNNFVYKCAHFNSHCIDFFK